MPAKDYFKVEKDVVFEIGLTPNRIDGASHIGTARDLAAFLNLKKNTKITIPSVDEFKIDNQDNNIEVIVENTQACPRYSGVTISGIEVKESPDWLKNRLKAIGSKPINNVVDITNFVLHETAQPLHAFDADKISGNKIIIKTLPEDSIFITLDEVERKLSAEDLMICDSERGMCIAGVFGGVDSGVTESTKNIFLESAHFNAVSIRKTSKRHTLNTDASFRFERGSDPNMTIFAMKRATLLIKELAGGTISSEIVDVYPEPINPWKVEIKFQNVERLIGKKLDKETIEKILLSLDFEIEKTSDKGMSLFVPTYRVDVKREADVIEEILRIYGYNNIEIGDEVKSSLSYAPKPDVDKLKNMVANMLSSNGFNEAMSNSLTKVAYYEKLETFKEENLVKMLNPLSSDLGGLRQTLLLGGLEAVAFNHNRKNPALKFYEFGNCYFYKNELQKSLVRDYSEEQHLALFISGKKNQINWNEKESQSDFFYLKTYVENTLKRLNYRTDLMQDEEIQNEIFAYGLTYSFHKKTFATFGLVNNKLLGEFDIDTEVFYADLNWTNILKSYNNEVRYYQIPKFPAVKRDLALLINKEITFKQIKDLAYKTERKLLRKVSLFDVYEGANLGEGKKSYAVSFLIMDEHKTLKDKQIDKIMNKLINVYKQELNAVIR
jgi:phenylalanyl-tRNA synthetase beta chain